MDIYTTLKADHATIKSLLDEISALGEKKPKTRQKLAEKFRAFVEAHSDSEEAVFYRPLLRHKTSQALALEGDVEHQVVADLLADLLATDPGEAKWQARFAVIRESLEHHIEEEEKETFSKARKVLSAPLAEKAGTEMEEKRSALLQQRGFGISAYRS